MKIIKTIVFFIVNNLTIILFTIGLTITIWRAYTCLQKYYNLNLSNKISLKSNSKTVVPFIIVCPSYNIAYQPSVLKKHGIEDRREYLKSLRSNDVAVDPRELFQQLTRNFSELIYDIKYVDKSGHVAGKDVLHFREIR